MPVNIAMIRRQERAELANGTTYEMSSTWTQEPATREMRAVGVQVTKETRTIGSQTEQTE
jgi:hypothetical protein